MYIYFHDVPRITGFHPSPHPQTATHAGHTNSWLQRGGGEISEHKLHCLRHCRERPHYEAQILGNHWNGWDRSTNTLYQTLCFEWLIHVDSSFLLAN